MADVSSTMVLWSTTPGSNNPTGATTIGTGLDDNLREIQAVVRTEYNKHVLAQIPCGRLTLTTGTPVTTSDVTAAETIFYTPFKGNTIALFDGTNWKQFAFSELSIDVPDATQMNDVFVYDNAGTVTLELTAWTNETTRATALTTQNGVLVKTGALTRRYVGSFYSTTAGNGQTEDSLAKRYVWNYYNRVRKTMRVVEATNTWSYSTATYRQANASTANQLDYVQGVSEDPVSAEVLAIAANTNANVSLRVGVGVDSTSANSAQIVELNTTQVANQPLGFGARYEGFPGVGRHFLAWLEHSAATATTTWIGDNGDATLQQAGISGFLLG
jgi:hypothetical protein